MKSTDDLAKLSAEIDEVDAALFALIARRFGIVDRVIAVKQRDGLPAAIPDRIEEVVKNALERAKSTAVPLPLVEQLWREIIAATIHYEEQAFKPSATIDDGRA